MRRILILIFVLLFFAPVFAYAQTPSARYCPNPDTDFFTGNLHEENGKPWVEVAVDPVFEKKMQEERYMGDLPLTPVYDLVVRIKPSFNYYCIPEWSEGKTVTTEQLPPFLHVTGALVVGSDDEVVVDPVVFSRTDEQDIQGRFVYERKMKGWTNGIASGKKLERLVDTISKQEPINVLLTISNPTKSDENIKSPVSFGLCAPIWGNGQHKIVGMYDVGTDTSEVVSYFDEVRQDGFASIEPYASNQAYFSYFVDLKKVTGGSTPPFDQVRQAMKTAHVTKPSLQMQNDVFSPYFSDSSCSDGIYLLKVKSANNTLGSGGVGGVAVMNNAVRGALIDTYGAQLVAGSRGASSVGVVYVHEFSHAFATLNDEYVYQPASLNVGLPLRNCSVRPFADFSIDSRLYGSTRYQGCSFEYDAGSKPGVPSAKYYRPSDKSLMNIGEVNQFNVVSCGFIMSAIKGGNAKSYFPECAKMDGVIKDGVEVATTENVFTQFISWLEQGSRSLSAGVGNVPFPPGTKVKVLVQNDHTPPADFEVVTAGEKLSKPEVCLDATGQSVFNRSPEDFRTGWNSEATCAQNVATATLLEEKIADMKQGLASIQDLVDALSLSTREVASLTTLDASVFALVSAGEVIEKPYGQIGNVAVQCVAGRSLPIGTSSTGKGELFSGVSPSLEKKSVDVQQKIDERYKDYQTEVKKSKGKVTHATLSRLTDLKEALAKDFVLVTKSALLGKESSFGGSGATISLAVTLDRDDVGKAKECSSFSWGVPTKLKIGGVKGGFVSSTVTFGDKVFEHDCVPEVYLLGELRDGINKNLSYYIAEKSKYENVLSQMESQLSSMARQAYGCLIDTSSTPRTQVVRKNAIPTARSGDTETTSEDVSGSVSMSSSESSYLIVESFDPNDRWGEIVQIVSDEEATGTNSSDIAESEPTVGICEAGTEAPKIIAVGGFMTAPDNPFFEWMRKQGTVAGEIPMRGKDFDQATSVLTGMIDEQIKEGNRVVVVAHSVGSFIAFNIHTNYPKEKVQFIYVDPPYNFFLAQNFLGGDFKKAKTAIDNGIATSSDSVIWTKGDALTNFTIHDPWGSLENIPIQNPPLDPHDMSIKGGQRLNDATRLGLSPEKDNELRMNLDSLEAKIKGKIVCSPVPTVKSPSIFSRILSGIKNVLSTATKPIATLFSKSLDNPTSTTGHGESALVSVTDPLLVTIEKENSEGVTLAPFLPTVGDQKTLVLLVLFEDSPEPAYSREMIEKYTLDESSLFQRFYQEQSYGKISFSGVVTDWTRINRSQFVNGKCIHLNPVKHPSDQPFFDELIKNKGINLGEYTRLAIVDYFSECGEGNAETSNATGIGATTVLANGEAHTMSVMNVHVSSELNPFTFGVSLKPEMNLFEKGFIHEMGHNLGLGHANGLDCYPDSVSKTCKLSGYGNPFDIMGNSNGGMHFNVVFKEKLGWLTSSDLVSVQESGTYTLKPLEGGVGKRAVRIDLLDGGAYYVEFRIGEGFDEGMNSAGVYRKQKDGIFINKTLPTYGSVVSFLVDTTRTTDDWLLDAVDSALLDDNVFIDSENGVRIGPITARSDSEISFDVMLGSVECATSKPTVYFLNVADAFGEILSDSEQFVRTRIINTDTSVCSPREFSLSLSAPEGWPTPETVTVTIPPQSEKEIVAMYRTPKDITGRFSFDVDVTDTNDGTVVFKAFQLVSVLPITSRATLDNKYANFKDLTTMNLFANKPILTGDSPEGTDSALLAGNMSIVTAIRRGGGAELSDTFTNVFQYSQNGQNFADWVQFDLSELVANTQANAKYTWKGGEGVWYFRVCVDITNAIAESDEDDNCSSATKVTVLPRVDIASGVDTSIDSTGLAGPAHLETETPVFLGRISGLSAELEGYMKIAARVRNTGGDSAPAFTSTFQYSQNGVNFYDWLDVHFPELGSGQAHTASYGWKGGAGTWYFRLCLEGSVDCSSATKVEIAE
ncbi:MAG: hypothetical protein COV91_01710 [Candidatus Taylorbacteria bacterium CG11_big_fil_rev_8_21_14_0_20_46_11]|uniref:CARDB domain-containing protein n=1 Tax=Candidatus Taylorbacteria bacterium CG11_big_fil_rev_8_21_14_0_20_46_11 TaxID=1975025 RepID=A0A2H0KCB9_9BACT|nr:MAG: hypothetical protein COV91_01710 [Candidatus Taylorbacteria bacterium CG11_big_fil_rev_8_21_14_0_20_46_11]